jgi:hypothetical protein
VKKVSVFSWETWTDERIYFILCGLRHVRTATEPSYPLTCTYSMFNFEFFTFLVIFWEFHRTFSIFESEGWVVGVQNRSPLGREGCAIGELFHFPVRFGSKTHFDIGSYCRFFTKLLDTKKYLNRLNSETVSDRECGV